MAARIIYFTNEEFDILGKYLHLGADYDSISINNKIIFMRDKFKEIETSTKPIIARVEAINLIRNVFGITDTGQGAKWIDFFINAGMLEVKEEVDLTLNEILNLYVNIDKNKFMTVLENNGYKIKGIKNNS